MNDVWVLSQMTEHEGGFPIAVTSTLGIAQVFGEADASEHGRQLKSWREGPMGHWSADDSSGGTYYEIRPFTIDAVT
jgi:hypothetical protein